MKLFRILLLIHFLSMTVYGQQMDSIRINHDTICFTTPNAFYFNHQNYETFNNSFITGSSFAVIRSQDNPRIYVDGIPMNPMIFTNTHYTDYLGGMNLLSYDIEKVMIKTLAHESRINAGQYNNSMDFKTFDVKPGKTKSQFEVNHFTAFTYQDIETRGYSTLTNVNVQQGFKKFGYRASFINGFMNDYLPENGLQRYSGNLKLNYQPIKAISLAGFIDYSNFQDFKREAVNLNETMESIGHAGYPSNGSGKNTLKANRLFSYLNADITLTKGVTIYGKWAQVNMADQSERYIFSNIGYLYGPSNIGNYKCRDYKDQSNYTDIGFRFVQPIKKNGLINFNIGYSQNDHHYDSNYESYFIESNGSRSIIDGYSDPVTKEKVFYTSLKINNKFISIQYLFNRNNYRNEKIFIPYDENMTFNNHLLSSNVNVIKNDTKAINQLGVQMNFGKLINYAFLYAPDNTKYANENMELVFYSSFLKHRLNLNLSFYQKVYGTYAHLFQFGSEAGLISYVRELGKVTKGGYDINGCAQIIKRKTLDWLMSFSYAENSAQLSDTKEFGLQQADTVINNTLISVTNSIRYKRFQLGIELERKEGFDVNLYRNNLSVAEPFPYWEQTTLITGVNNAGAPTSERINYIDNYIASADYFILRHVGLEYEIKPKSRNLNYAVGIQYDKMRRLYLYVNDGMEYNNQFQRPSFYHSLSLSFKMRF